MDAQAGLSLTWSQTPKTGFLVTRFIYQNSSYPNSTSASSFSIAAKDEAIYYYSFTCISTFRSNPFIVAIIFCFIMPPQPRPDGDIMCSGCPYVRTYICL